MDEIEYIAKNFECPVCKEKFSNVWDAFGHLSDKHPINENKEGK